jgi:hypothetical protein
LDCYTGSLTTEIELNSNEITNKLLNQFLSEGQAEDFGDLSGISFNAECKKLEEKLF